MATYTQAETEYENVAFESKKIQVAMKKHRNARKLPTSIALDPGLLQTLKQEAQKRGIPYQVMLRMLKTKSVFPVHV